MSAWLEEAVRWGQVNFNERDPAELDVGWWADHWAACRLQGVTLNIGGPVAFYPTDVPLHRRSPHLGERDLFGETAAAAKALGMRVLGRLDPSFTTREVYDAHPDWCLTRADGSPVVMSPMLLGVHGGVADADESTSELVYLSCANSPYYSGHLLEVIEEVLTRYDVNGIFTNAWPAQQAVPLSVGSMCHCPHCLDAWERANPGLERPTAADPRDPAWRAYVEFVVRNIEAVQQRFRSHVQRLRPDATFLSIAFPSPGSNLHWGRWIDLVDALGADAQTRRTMGVVGQQAPALWEVGQQSELLRSVARGKPMFRFCATYLASQPFLRHGTNQPAETRVVMAEALAHGERPKWHTLGGVSHDRRWMAGVRELDEWMADHDRWIRGREPVSDVAVLWSPRSVQLEDWSDAPLPSHRDALLGWHVALTEARIPFSYVHEHHLDDLAGHAVVILPTGLALPDDALDAIRGFDGGLVACCGALAADEWGQPRDPDAVAEVLGGRYGSERVGPLQHAYLEVDRRTPLFGGVGDTDVVGAGRWVTPFAVAGDGASGGALVPDYPTNPTHLVVRPAADPSIPVLATNGHRVHIAADLDAAHGRHGLHDHGLILRNAVATALGGRSPRLTVTGDGLVDARAWRHPHGRSIFLVNLDNPMLHGSPVRAHRPIGPFEVRLDLGEGAVTSVHLLRHDAECDWHIEEGRPVVRVPRVEDFEVVAVELS